MKIENVAVLGTAMTRFADHRDRTLVERETNWVLSGGAGVTIDIVKH